MSGSFFLVSARDKVIHWPIPISSRWTCLAAATLLCQVLYPLSFDSQDLKVCFHDETLGLACLKGILSVSTLISQVKSQLPMGPSRNRCDLSLVGIKIWFLKTYVMRTMMKRPGGQKEETLV